jgi:hypothetical protein
VVGNVEWGRGAVCGGFSRSHHRPVNILVFGVSTRTHFFSFSGKNRCDTVLIYLSSDDVEEDRIKVNKVAPNNLRVKLGDLVGVHPCRDITYGKRLHILPFDDSIEGFSGDIFDVYLNPYFFQGVYSSS